MKKQTVGVIGIGYVGLPTMVAIGEAGLKTIGFDIDKNRVRLINAGKSFISEISDEHIKKLKTKISATSDWKNLKKCDVVLIAVPTPLSKHKTPDTSAIEKAGEKIAKNLKNGQLVVLESTTYPGTTEELLKPILEKSGLVAGKDFFLAFAPERIDPGNKEYSVKDVPKVVGGINKKSTDVAAAFYKKFIKKVHKVSSPKTAEMSKLLENIYRLVNISLVNELKLVADKMDIDFWEVIEAAKTKPYGFAAFYPGPGVGGHCIPVDPFYLSWKAREYDFFARFIDLAAEINEMMPSKIVAKITWSLNSHKKSVRDSKILILGVAYKKDIDDTRESPAIPIISSLLKKGADVSYHDPYIPNIDLNGREILHSTDLVKNNIKKFDCVVVLTNHSKFDYKIIAKEAKLVVDTRNSFKEKKGSIIR